MVCISQDIRTPSAGAMDYLQLLNGEPERLEEYLVIVKARLGELDVLLDELFLYTRLLNDHTPLECRDTETLPPLWYMLAEFYPQLEKTSIQPELRFDQENMTVLSGTVTHFRRRPGSKTLCTWLSASGI